MNSIPPFVAQERPDTCALACLRMILAYYGQLVTEADLLEHLSLLEGGADPEQIAGLARTFGLRAEIKHLDTVAIRDLVRDGVFPIVLVDRTPLDQEFAIHALIPVRFTQHYVSVLDPLSGQRRISIRKFQQAQLRIGWAIVCQIT